MTPRPIGRPGTARIERRGGKLEAYRPLERSGNALPVLFSRLKTDDDVLSFVEKHGPLTREGLQMRQGEYVTSILQSAALMRTVMLGDKMLKNLDPVLLGKCEIYLVSESNKPPRVEWDVTSLQVALWLRLSERLLGGTSFVDCKHCGQPFERGPGTGRRKDQEFCGIPCRTKHNNENRPSRVKL